MQRYVSAILASLGLVGVLAPGQVFAQFPYSRPPTQFRPTYQTPSPISPYLQLLNPGATTFNYYNFVRPQQQFNASIQQLQQQVSAEQQALAGQTAPVLPDTGHVTRFMNTGNYFFSSSGQPGVAAGPQAGNRPQAPRRTPTRGGRQGPASRTGTGQAP
jgi:hypothetical protein